MVWKIFKLRAGASEIKRVVPLLLPCVRVAFYINSTKQYRTYLSPRVLHNRPEGPYNKYFETGWCVYRITSRICYMTGKHSRAEAYPSVVKGWWNLVPAAVHRILNLARHSQQWPII